MSGKNILINHVTSLDICYKSCKFAFTLVEVLITTAIIGVVAAVTIPVLVNNYNKKIVEVRLQKTYAVLTQAFKFAEGIYGDSSGWDFVTSNEDIDNFLNTYLLPNIKYQKYCGSNNIEECFNYPVKSASGLYGYSSLPHSRALIFNNGLAILFQSGLGANNKHIHIVVDVNGPHKGYNLLGKDIFSMIFYINTSSLPYESGFAIDKTVKSSGFFIYGNQCLPAFTREEMLELCAKDNPRICSAIIQNDGWKIKEDYPWW